LKESSLEDILLRLVQTDTSDLPDGGSSLIPASITKLLKGKSRR